ncbi:MAG TPA: protein kinase [Terriglobia bacterium]|nr:protein kinase [Terriglobia bacterium]
MGSPAVEVAARMTEETPNVSLVGCQLGTCQVLSLLGKGGMGEVYLGRDSRLGRQVAIKVLPDAFTRDPERLARFEREARLLASLNHPNIATIYEIGESNGIHWIAMELIVGKTLADWIRSRPLKIVEVLDVGIQVARGLEEAHARGIIHRDLKPSNVMVTDTGLAKILDFGTAKIAQAIGPDDSTLGLSTLEGKIVGTPPYMSPEQAQARKLDTRSDIFSFGALIYETVTGRRAFNGESNRAVIEAVMSAEPPPLGRHIPLELRKLIEHCLRKDPERRIQSVADIRIELEDIKGSQDFGRHKFVRDKLTWFLALLLVAVILVGIVVWTLWPSSFIPEFESVQVTSSAGWEGEPAISPDGSRIAYASNESGNLNIYVTDIFGNAHRRLTDDLADDTDPAWFPDGSTIAFTSDRGGRTAIWKIGAEGGGATLLLDNAIDPAISSDLNHPRLAFARLSPTGYRIGIASLENPGNTRIITDDPGEPVNARNPAWSPDGKSICYVDRQELWVIDANVGGARRITSDGHLKQEPAWSPDSRRIYFVGFQQGAAALRCIRSSGGQSKRVTSGTGAESHPSVSRDGRRLVYATNEDNHQIVLLDRRSGKKNVLQGSDLSMPAIAPDGSKVVFISMRPGQEDLWLQPIQDQKPTGAPRRLRGLGGISSHPAFSPDGRWIVCYRILMNNREIWTLPLSGESAVQFTHAPPSAFHPAWSLDGSRIAFVTNQREIWVASVKQGNPVGTPERIAAGEFFAVAPAWSLDSKRLAFVASLGDQSEVWLVPADASGPAFKLTSGADARCLHWDAATGDILASGSWGQNRVSLRSVDPKSGNSSPFWPEVEFGLGTSPELGLFDITRDGKGLAFSKVELRGHVWMSIAAKGTF